MRGNLGLIGALSVLLLLSTDSVSAQQTSHAEDLLAGKSVSLRLGNSVLFQQVYGVETKSLIEKLNSGPQGLRGLIPELRHAKAFRTPDGRKLMYLRVRGIAQTDGLLMEVRQGLDELYAEAQVLDVSVPSAAGFRPQLVGSAYLRGFNSAAASIVLEGPLNSPIDLAGLGALLEIHIHEVEGERSLLSTQLSLYSQRPQEALGDYLGITSARMSAAQFAGRRLFAAFESRLK